MSRRICRKKPEWQRKIARERIEILLSQAEKALREEKIQKAKRYVELARTIGKRYNVRLTKAQKAKFCKGCNIPLIPGLTSKIWLDPRTKCIVIKCLHCNRIYRKPYYK